MHIERFGIVSYCHNFTGPGSGFTQISQQNTYRIIPKCVASPATSITIDTAVFNFLTSRAKLLHADEVKHIFSGRVGLSFIQCGLKIVKYIQYIVGVSRQDVLKWSHVTKMFYISVLTTDFTIALITFMVSARAPHLVQFRLRSQMDFLFEVLCLWFAKHVWLLKCLLHSAQSNLTPAYAHGGIAMQSLHVCSQWWVAALALDFLHALHTYFYAIAPAIFTIT